MSIKTLNCSIRSQRRKISDITKQTYRKVFHKLTMITKLVPMFPQIMIAKTQFYSTIVKETKHFSSKVLLNRPSLIKMKAF